MGQSEVARIREQIERENQALKNALGAPAVVGTHRFINARYAAMGRHQKKLAKLVGEEKSLAILCEIVQ